MHELGILYQTLRAVDGIAQKNHIKQIKHITLEIGEDSGVVQAYMEKLFPVAAERFPLVQNARLNFLTIPGKELHIKDIGY